MSQSKTAVRAAHQVTFLNECLDAERMASALCAACQVDEDEQMGFDLREFEPMLRALATRVTGLRRRLEAECDRLYREAAGSAGAPT